MYVVYLLSSAGCGPGQEAPVRTDKASRAALLFCSSLNPNRTALNQTWIPRTFPGASAVTLTARTCASMRMTPPASGAVRGRAAACDEDARRTSQLVELGGGSD